MYISDKIDYDFNIKKILIILLISMPVVLINLCSREAETNEFATEYTKTNNMTAPSPQTIISKNKGNDNKMNPEIELYEKYKDSPQKQEEYLNELLMLQIRRTLGEDFSREKSSKMAKLAKMAREKKEFLAKELQKGSLTKKEYLNKLSLIFDKLNQGYKEILTPSEYKKFMGQQ